MLVAPEISGSANECQTEACCKGFAALLQIARAKLPRVNAFIGKAGLFPVIAAPKPESMDGS
jgi:hypothetical protein